MKIAVYLLIFAITFGSIVIAAQSFKLPDNEVVVQSVGTTHFSQIEVKKSGISTTACGVSVEDVGEKVENKNPLEDVPSGLPEICQPKVATQQWKEPNPTNDVIYTDDCIYTNYYRWQPVVGQPVMNVARFFHNRRPVRRVLGWMFFRRCL